jgi:hypothetical protein
MLEIIDMLPPEMRADGSSRRVYPYVCLCDCGSLSVFDGVMMTGGLVASCGCTKFCDIPLTPERARFLMNSAASCATRRSRMKSAGGKFTADQIEELFKKQKFRCANCRVKLNYRTLRRDHRQALASGGSNDILNIELLCDPCNNKKSAKDEILWAAENGRLI